MAKKKKRSNKNSIWRLLLRNKMFIGGAGIILCFCLMAILAPVIAPTDPDRFVGGANIAPSAEFWMGTTALGKDVFSQTVWGARNSLIIGFGTSIIAIIVALAVGMTAGYFGGIVDDILTLIMNIFLVIPGLPLLIVLSGYLEPGTTTVIFVLALTGWAFAARIIRSQMLSLRSQDFVAAAMVSGESPIRIIFVEIMPNMASIIVGLMVGGVSFGIAAATALSFLGLTDISAVTWGTNLYWAQNGNALLVGAWWTFVPSGLSVALVIFGLALINYAMDEITNPRLRAEKEVKNVINGQSSGDVLATPVIRQ